MVRSWADGSGAIGAIEPFTAVGMLSPSGVTPGVGRRAVAGAEHPDLVAEGPQRPGEREHLALHAAGQGEAVGADEADAHGSAHRIGRRRRPTGPTAGRGWGLPMASRAS